MVVERAPRDRRSLDILSVKNEAKLSASEVNHNHKSQIKLNNAPYVVKKLFVGVGE